MASKSKHISELTGEEMARIGQAAVMKVRAKIFARGGSVVWDRKGLVVREYSDGRQEILENTLQGTEQASLID